MMHRSAAGIVHSLLRNSITAAEAPASACTGLLVGPSLLQGLLGGSMSASQVSVRCVPCTALVGDGPSHCLRSCSTADVIGARRTVQAAQQRGYLTVTGTVGARTVSNISAARGWSSEPCGSVISRQFTSLRELAPAVRPEHAWQAHCQRARPCSWRPAVLPPQQHQVRCFAAAGSSGGSSRRAASSAAAGSRRTAQRVSVDQKSSSQALYLVRTSTQPSSMHQVCRSPGDDTAKAVPCQVFEGLRMPQVAMIVGMVGVTYASVPLYRMFCQVSAVASRWVMAQ